MHVGLLTSRFSGKEKPGLAEIAEWSAAAGFRALELSTGTVRPADILADKGAAVRNTLQATGLELSSLAHYDIYNGRNNTPERYTQAMLETLAAAELLGVKTVCTLAGFPANGKDKVKTIREDLPQIFEPIIQEAARLQIRIAFENWFATNLQGLECFEALVEALPADHVGFNFDPSHLYWQGIDYLGAVEKFRRRIFHTHAKDVAVNEAARARVGVLGSGWWRYVIPGLGRIHWGEYIHQLKACGYDGVLSIEHEDGAYQAKPGFELGLRHLRQFC